MIFLFKKFTISCRFSQENYFYHSQRILKKLEGINWIFTDDFGSLKCNRRIMHLIYCSLGYWYCKMSKIAIIPIINIQFHHYILLHFIANVIYYNLSHQNLKPWHFKLITNHNKIMLNNVENWTCNNNRLAKNFISRAFVNPKLSSYLIALSQNMKRPFF